MTPWGGAQDEGVLGAGVDLQLEIGVEGLAVLDALDAAEEGLGEAADEEAEEDVDGDAEEGESQPSVLWRVSCQTVPRPKVRVRVQGCGAHCTGSTALPIEGCWVFLSPNFAEEGAGRRVLVSVGGEGEDAWVTPGSCQLGPRRARVV